MIDTTLLLEGIGRVLDSGGSESACKAAEDALNALVKRDDDVQTLDEWATERRSLEWSTVDCTGQWCCDLMHTLGGFAEHKEFYGATPDEARAKAAAWVREPKAVTAPLNPADVQHMSREELEDAAAYLKLAWTDSDSDAELREAVLWHATENARRDNPEQCGDERADTDVYEGVE